MSGVSNTEPLRRLLQEQQQAHDLSLRDLEAAADGRRARTWFENLLKDKSRRRLLDPDEIALVADVFRTTERRVREADLRGHGLVERDEQPAAWVLEDEVQHLSEQQRVAIRAVIAAMGGEALIQPTPLRRDSLQVVGDVIEGVLDDVEARNARALEREAARLGDPAQDEQRAQDSAAEAPQVAPEDPA